ncbi:uncharacterized protein DNG_09777 [Cephalotrichum gorgonifer]|uniref:Amine oxidase domain-containing protein n=1 Tax=Cephalotrichum gorgonifer TaxID=2041049 RepID=A0AAE8N836_9PEZI|nr:uncharacterized protein DNG_09777 [Cephalotrichum gorgonifer]
MHLSTSGPSVLGALALASTAVAETAPSAGSAQDLFLKRILAQSDDYGELFDNSPQEAHNLTVGIIGGGAAGLYAALLLESLDIDYEILESSERIGGRIFTHRFNPTAWEASEPGQPDYYDYYDAGAMRFPGMEWMDRIIGEKNNSLVSYINSKVQPKDQVNLIPYYFQANNTFRLFNDILAYNQENPSAETFEVLVSDGGTIEDDAFAALSPGDVFHDEVEALINALTEDFDTGFQLLMQYDSVSVRQYLLQQGYSHQQVDWIETIADATTHYDTFALSEAVMEQWIFHQSPLDSWTCVEGGMDRIVNGMVKTLARQVETGKRVTAIKSADEGALTVVINGEEERTYDHVISTVPLGSLQVIDLTELDLAYRKKVAIRKLQYDPAGKIGIKFKTRWWETLQSGTFQGGQSFSDLPIRRCVYPSYGLDIPDAPGTMIASYTWGQDSARLGAYYTEDASRERIIDITIRNLAAMHNVTYEFLLSEYVDAHLWNWYEGEDAVGAFALFGPGEYSTVLPALMAPGAHGRLHFAGEALSSGHGWIIGAVNSAYRTVAETLAVEQLDDKLFELVDKWGLVNEVDMGWYSQAFAS